MRQLGQNASRSIHPERRGDQLLVYKHSQVLRYVRIHQIRHRAVVGSSRNRQGAISQCSLCDSLHIACFPSSFSLLLPSWSIWSIHREKCSTLPPFQWFHSALAPVSMFTTDSNNCLFLFSSAPPTPARFNRCAIPRTSCSGVRDPR